METTDPVAETVGLQRVYRGGYWNSGASLTSVNSRSVQLATTRDYRYGFRLVRTAE